MSSTGKTVLVPPAAMTPRKGWAFKELMKGRKANVLAMVAQGASIAEASRQVGLGHNTVGQNAARDPQFAADLEHARDQGARNRVHTVEDRVFEAACADSYPDRKLYLQGNATKYKDAKSGGGSGVNLQIVIHSDGKGLQPEVEVDGEVVSS